MIRAVRTHPAAGVSVSWFSTHTKKPRKKKKNQQENPKRRQQGK